MSIVVNGTTIPTTVGSIKVNGTNITKVVCNGTTVWEKVTSTIKYFIQNSVAKITSSNFITDGKSINSSYTDSISSNYSSSVNTTGTQVIIMNDAEAQQVAQFVKFSESTSFSGKTLYMNCHCYLSATGQQEINAPFNNWSRGNVFICLFDSSNNVLQYKYIGNFGKIPIEKRDEYPDDFFEDINLSGSMVLPSTGSGYIGYGILMNGSHDNTFTIDVSQLYIS